MSTTSAHAKNRIVFLDIARAYACVMMIFGHTFESVLDNGLRTGALFTAWDHWRGLTAPTFLFISGFAFFIATTRYWDHYTRWTPRLAKRLRRVGLLLVIAYVLHMPVSNPLGLLHSGLTYPQWFSWMRVDILHCIAVSLLLLHGLILVFRRRQPFLLFTALAMPLVFLLSPFIWFLNGTVSEPSIWNFYLGANFHSQFPLIPWIGFMYAGILAGHGYTVWLKNRPRWPLILLATSGGVLLFGLLIESMYHQLPVHFHFHSLQAQTLWLRLAVVMIIVSVIALLVQRLRSIPDVVSLVGRETLTLYWMHLIVVYGSPWNKGLVKIFGRTLPPWQCLLVFMVLFVVLLGIILLKERLKRIPFPRLAVLQRCLLRSRQ
ncbi:MAG: DUF1624 domain-containing protein [Acidobacteria bacterium]|nr:DUF1624 domain-containing protein [Acidobacteriota bacterium]